jgi:ABC-type multidrug transport system permease subunit
MFANVQATVLALPLQRKIFQREYPLNMYSSIAYLMGKVPIEYSLSAIQTMVQLLISYFLCQLEGNFGIYFLVLMVVTISADSMALSISCITDSPMSAIQMLPIVIFPQIIFSGLLVAIQSMPPWISWFQYVCFLPYAMKLLTINEFGCADITIFTNNDISCSNIAVNATILVCFAIVFRLIALVALQFKPKTYK